MIEARQPAVSPWSELPVIWALTRRDLHVLRGQYGQFILRTAMQPFFFVLIFSYLLPTLAGPQAHSRGAANFATVLLPGILGTTIVMQGLQAVSLPLVAELSLTKEMEDRALAPISIPRLALQRAFSGCLQALLAGLVVLPVLLIVHTPHSAPAIDIANVGLLTIVFVLIGIFAGTAGLLIGVAVKPQKITLLFTLLVVPVTFLGCAYYPWQSLGRVPWLQHVVLVNPLVYVNESLRAVLTAQQPHMSLAWSIPALAVGIVVTWAWGSRSFARRLLQP